MNAHRQMCAGEHTRPATQICYYRLELLINPEEVAYPVKQALSIPFILISYIWPNTGTELNVNTLLRLFHHAVDCLTTHR